MGRVTASPMAPLITVIISHNFSLTDHTQPRVLLELLLYYAPQSTNHECVFNTILLN